MSVVSGSPAEAAGLRAGDVIIEADGAPTADAGDLQRLMMSNDAIGRRVAECSPIRRAQRSLPDEQLVPHEDLLAHLA